MRVDFVKAVTGVLDREDRAMLLTGDLGYSAFEDIAARHPTKFINAGVCEQNMIGVAAGLALGGYRPWVYSIATFLTLRPYEQIRNDLCFHRLPVCLVGNGGGYSYGVLGSTHHALEDLGVLKCLPELTLLFPQAADQVAAAVSIASGLSGPAYLRLASSGFTRAYRPPLYENPTTLTRRYAVGDAVTVIGVGHAVHVALAALPELARHRADVFGISRFPFDLESDRLLVESARRTGRVIVLDEHVASGSIAESLLYRLSTVASGEILAAELPHAGYGTPLYLSEQAGLTPTALAAKVAAIARSLPALASLAK